MVAGTGRGLATFVAGRKAQNLYIVSLWQTFQGKGERPLEKGSFKVGVHTCVEIARRGMTIAPSKIDV